MATPEGAVKAKIKGLLRTLTPCRFYMPIQNGMGEVGISDFICCINGRFVAIEAKAPGKVGNTTANQDRFLREVAAAGGVAIVADSLDSAWEQLHVHGLAPRRIPHVSQVGHAAATRQD